MVDFQIVGNDLFVDGEWYATGDYEYLDNMVQNIINCRLEEECCTGYEEY